MCSVLLTDGRLRVLVGRLSISDTVTDTTEPVRLLFTDASGFITCYVSAFSVYTLILSCGHLYDQICSPSVDVVETP